MKAIYTAIITPFEDQSGFFCRVPDLPGCVTDGETIQDAIAMVQDAANLIALDYEQNLPTPTPQQALNVPDGAIITLVTIDTIAYRSKIETRAVRKSVSLPAWMSNLADERGINVSKVLQDGLMAVFEC